MESSDSIGVVQADGTIRTKGEPNGEAWTCGNGHTIVLRGDEFGREFSPQEKDDPKGPCWTVCNQFPCDKDWMQPPKKQTALPTDSLARKNTPLASGCLYYFPAALAAVARLSKKGNDKHNPGEPLHWSRDKSQDHGDCVVRHQVDFDILDPETEEYHAAAIAWRALAQLQELEEKRWGLPVSRGSR